MLSRKICAALAVASALALGVASSPADARAGGGDMRGGGGAHMGGGGGMRMGGGAVIWAVVACEWAAADSAMAVAVTDTSAVMAAMGRAWHWERWAPAWPIRTTDMTTPTPMATATRPSVTGGVALGAGAKFTLVDQVYAC
jgi:hypothetical protein